MTSDEIEEAGDADHAVGAFTLTIRRSGRLFECLLHERVGGILHNVRLDDDPRLDWFGPLLRFEREIAESDVPTFNAHIWRKKQNMPLWRMDARGVHAMLARLQELSPKKGKKR